MKIIFIILLLSSYHSELINIQNLEESKMVENEIKNITVEDQNINVLKLPIENTLSLNEKTLNLKENIIPNFIPEKKDEIKIFENNQGLKVLENKDLKKVIENNDISKSNENLLKEKKTEILDSPEERQLYLKPKEKKKENLLNLSKKEKRIYEKIALKIKKYKKLKKRRELKKKEK